MSIHPGGIHDSLLRLKYSLKTKVNELFANDTPPAASLKAPGLTPTLEELRNFSEKHSFASILPYESYDEASDLYYNKDTVGFMLIGSGATGLSETDLITLNSIFTDNHPPDTCIQITMVDDPRIEPILENWRKSRESRSGSANDEIFNTMAQNRVQYLKTGKWRSLFKDAPYLVRDYKIIISYTVPMNDFQMMNGLEPDLLEHIQRTKLSIRNTLTSGGIFTDSLHPDGLIQILDELLNPSMKERRRLRWDKDSPINVQIIDPETTLLLGSSVSSLISGDESYSILPYQIRQFPPQWAGYRNGDLIGSFTSNLHRLPCKFIATLTVTIPEQISAKGEASRKSLRATQMSDSPVSKFVPQWKDRKIDWDFVQDKLVGGDKLLKATYQIVLICPQGKEQESDGKLKSLYESFGWLPSRNRYIPKHSILSVLPMGLSINDKNDLQLFGTFRTMPAWCCTQIAPWIGEWKGTRTPMMLFLGRRGQLTYFNPFDNTKGNFNSACCATSGAGKSFVIQEWATSISATGGKVFVIDAGHSYRNLCNLLGGTYIDFGEMNPKLNPFSSLLSNEELDVLANKRGSDPTEFKKDYYNDFIPMLKDLIGQMASPNAPLQATEASCLEKAISHVLKRKGNKASISDVAETLSDDKSKSSEANISNNVALMLHPYTKEGMYGKYFEGESNIDLSNNFVVLELDALNAKGDLQSVVLLLLMIKINQAMFLSGNKSQKKICIIDEAWRLLGKGRAGAFIEEGYRVARKHGGSYATITQSIADYYSSSTAEAALKNSDFVLFLRQKGEDLSRAVNQKYIDDSDGKVSLMRSLETVQGKYSEIAISTPDGMSIVRFCVDPITEKLYSTKAEEVDYLRKAQKEGKTVFQAINELLSKSNHQR